MPTRNVVMTGHQEAFIGELVRCGRYKNASEVLREGLRVMERRESLVSVMGFASLYPSYVEPLQR